MNKLISHFLDRLSERLAVLMASAVSSRVEGLRAEVQADQQSHLEDLARSYEADGKIEIAASLRKRASQLTAQELAADAIPMIEQTISGMPRLSETPQATPDAPLKGITQQGARKNATRKKPQTPTTSENPFPELPSFSSEQERGS